MFEILNDDNVPCGNPVESCSEAAQEAEFLHSEFGVQHRVVDSQTRETCYETAGAPE